MRIAVLCKGSLDNMKGVMNYIHEKVRRFQEMQNSGCVEVDTYLLETEWTWSFRLLINHNILKHSRSLKESSRVQDGVYYHYIKYKYSAFDSFFTTKIKGEPISERELDRMANLLNGYDVIASHNPICHNLALKVKERFGIPVVLTWHGSDINVFPYTAPWKFDLVKTEIESADMNLFVSKALMNNSNQITEHGEKGHIYTGPSSYFKRFSELEKIECRKKYGDGRKYIIGFVGNLVDVKNVLILPQIFHQIVQQIPSDDVTFVIAGDGDLMAALQNELNNLQIRVKFLGRVAPLEIPSLMNSLDVLVLPSKHEGLPLVVLEARTCGANVVGSQVDGIPEGIGQQENCFALDKDFVRNVSLRILEIIRNGEQPQPLSEEFSWESAIEKEYSIYESLIQRNK